MWGPSRAQATEEEVFTAAPTLVSVRSRGSLRLRSADPSWHPEIDAAYFDDGADLDNLRTHTQTLYHPVATCAMGNSEETVMVAEKAADLIRGASAG